MTSCHTCELVERRNVGDAPLWDSIFRTPYWDVVHCNSTSLLGWLILVQRRHIAAIEELSEAEAIELGKLIRHVSIVVTELTGCIKTYVVQFAEAPGHNHVHFHIIPRMPNQLDEHRGPGVFKQLGVLEAERVSETAMNELAQKVRRYLETQLGDQIVEIC
ncbi:MAG: HIT family protein [Chloroflexi bacterium]|nr:HIT family protein [Chloroflexota bacterium]